MVRTIHPDDFAQLTGDKTMALIAVAPECGKRFRFILLDRATVLTIQAVPQPGNAVAQP